MSARRPAPMRITSVPPARASAAQSVSVVPLAGSSWPVTTVTWVDRPRWVTGIPAYAGAAIALVMPGTTSNGTPAAISASASSPPRPNTNGSPPLRRTTVLPGAPVLDEHRVDAVLVHRDRARRLADVDALGARRREVEQRRVREPVVDHDVGDLEQRRAAAGEQPGVTGSGPDQVDGHRGGHVRDGTGDVVGVERPVRPPSSSSSATRDVCAERVGIVGPSRSVRSTMRPSSDARSTSSTIEPSSARRASAPHGRLQPPPSSARNARSARISACAAASSIVAERFERGRRRRRGTRPRARPGRPGAAASTGRAARSPGPRGRAGRAPRPRRPPRRSRRPARGGSGCCRAARRT